MTKSILHLFGRLTLKKKFPPISYWRHAKNRFLYVCCSEKYIKNEEMFTEIFPFAIRVPKWEFQIIAFFNKKIEIVFVADDNIHDHMNILNEESYNSGESEDRDINEN
jgi:hypothetical protein